MPFNSTLVSKMLYAINKHLDEPRILDAVGGGEDSFGAFSIDNYRPMRVAVIGAGASGIVAAIR